MHEFSPIHVLVTLSQRKPFVLFFPEDFFFLGFCGKLVVSLNWSQLLSQKVKPV